MSAVNKFLWWQKGVIYQIYPRSFMDADGDGVGDIPGIIQRLDYLTDILAVDAIWLSPFYPSPMADFGYDVANYTDIDPLFGDLDDFDRLIEQAHNRDLKIIIDFVPNHSSDQHPWFIESSSSRANPKRSWYTWRDAKQDGSPPNNWLSVFGGSAWEWHPPTDQYYLHSFLKEQPDLNWRDPNLKEAMFEVLRFWLDREVDGFRIDVAHFIMKDPELRDNPLKPVPSSDYHKSLGDYDSQIMLHNQNHADIHPLYREIRQLLEEYSSDQPRVSIGEIHIFDWHEWAEYYGQDLDELHLPMNFQLLGIDLQPAAIQKVVESMEQAIPPGAWPNFVIGNHDETRIASRRSEPEARLSAMLLLTLRGTPVMYYGDEIGMREASIPPERLQDPWGIRVPGLGRDGCRTPMQWTSQSGAGFSAAGANATWLPIHENYRKTNVDDQLREQGSILNLYRQLLSLRKSAPALQVGSFTQIKDVHEGCYAYKRSVNGSSTYFVMLNFSAEKLVLNISQPEKGRLRISTLLDREEIVDMANLHLRGFEGTVIESIA